jgi:hypothetical protein
MSLKQIPKAIEFEQLVPRHSFVKVRDFFGQDFFVLLILRSPNHHKIWLGQICSEGSNFQPYNTGSLCWLSEKHFLEIGNINGKLKEEFSNTNTANSVQVEILDFNPTDATSLPNTNNNNNFEPTPETSSSDESEEDEDFFVLNGEEYDSSG